MTNETITIIRAQVTPEAWSWLVQKIGLPPDNRHAIELIADSDIAREFKTKFASKLMPDWQKRVLEERDQLKGRIDKLEHYVNTDQYERPPFEDQGLLRTQLFIMREYHSILEARIARFK